MVILKGNRYHMTVNDAAIKARLQDRAHRLGCAALGVTAAGPVRDHGRLTQWLQRGWAADMSYLSRHADTRADPRRLLQSARSVILIAVPYSTAPPPPEPVAGHVAALFAGRDYHGVVRRILDRLAETLEVDTDGVRSFVDTGPVLERSLAVTAGLGAIGRHTQLLIPGYGARVTLGVLLTERELQPDEPFDRDLCGDCQACLQACPTAALRDSQGLDARRCLSYWTTASRAPIPASLRPSVGNRLYGCDTCQLACPHDPAPASGCEPPPHPELLGDTERALPTLHGLLTLSGKALKRTLAESALAWLGRTAILRTTCVVLGNYGHTDSVEPLAAALQDRDAIVRGHAAWALGRYDTSAAKSALRAAAATETDPATQQEIQDALL